MGAAANVANWLQQLWNVAFNGAALTPGQIWLNFTSGFSVTNNPTGGPNGAGSFDIAVATVLTPEVVAVTAGSTLLPPNEPSLLVEFDTNGGATAVEVNAASADGYAISCVDVGLVTSGTKTFSITDANGYEFQDPDQPLTFVSTYTLTTTRNVAWVRGTCARTGVTAWYS